MAETRELRELISWYVRCASSSDSRSTARQHSLFLWAFGFCESFGARAFGIGSSCAAWLRDLGLQFRLDYGSRPLHTSGLDGSRAYVGLKNLGNSCYVNSVLQCFYGCGPLREDIAGQPSPKGPLAALVQQLFRRLSGRDGQWDYVAPAAVLRQVFLTNEAAFQPGDSADILDCCHLFLHSCLSHSGLYLELPQRAGVSS